MKIQFPTKKIAKKKVKSTASPHKFWARVLIISVIIIVLQAILLFLFFTKTSELLDAPADLGVDMTGTRLETLEKRVKKMETSINDRTKTSSQKNTPVVE